MFRTFFTVAAIATLAALSSSLFGQQAPPAHRPMTLPKPVNLKVLPSDTSPDDLMKIMHGYSEQLGVHCTFCHAEDAAGKHVNFASDQKPEKNTARTMLSMTNEINAKYLSQIHDPDASPAQKIVTCGTCHQGHNMPVPFKAPEHPKTEHPGMDHPGTPPQP